MNTETDPKPTANATQTSATMPKLRLKQTRFIEAYLGVAQGNGTEAARIAGYSGTTAALGAMAYETLKKPYIQTAIAVRTAEIEAETGYDVAKWRKDCIKALRDAQAANDRVCTVQALKLLGMHVGSFAKDNAQKGKPVGVIVFGPQTTGALPTSTSPALPAAPTPPMIDAELVATDPGKPETQSPDVSTTV